MARSKPGVVNKGKYEMRIRLRDRLVVAGQFDTLKEATAAFRDYEKHKNSFNKRSLPLTRAECVDGIRPCPYYTCRHHLWSDPEKKRHKDIVTVPKDKSTPSCSLDVADAGQEMRAEDIADLVGLSRSNVYNAMDSGMRTIKEKFDELDAVGERSDAVSKPREVLGVSWER